MKIWPFEFSATPDTSPRYKSGGSFRRFETESKGISGTASCANAAEPTNSSAVRKYFMEASKRPSVSQRWQGHADFAACPPGTRNTRLSPHVHERGTYEIE